MFKKKSTNKSFFDYYLMSIYTIKQILTEGNYFESSNSEEQKIKISVEEDSDIILLEIKLQEQKGNEFMNTLKNNSLTKHIPVLMVSQSKTQIFWDQFNLKGTCFNNMEPGNHPWLLLKIHLSFQ